ncbi:flagellar biosynthesis anti-sigma factor FlgM [Halanaerobacter jeridensis]|uniref:Negative regulator of flagellin synthesis n=1 Tax=Halanaerobacter jeridensis TaxID=706427 RepID=A0A938XTJ7_9FIRM|nr:flagellar biosynthesis anti-sigma factor FlgM [Halanaerobacter jeridensis]MBM7557476.1 negative regulator of flagellin synthesis FlgM [Halanaerobacter jeridensis]
MKIDSVGVSKLLSKYNNQNKNDKTDKTEAGSKKDSFSISESAQQLQKAKAEMNKISEARQEKVKRLKKEVEQGTYNVSGEEVAEKMLNQAKLNKLV